MNAIHNLKNIRFDLIDAINELEGYCECTNVRQLPVSASLLKIKKAAADDAQLALGMIDDIESAAKRLRQVATTDNPS